MLFVSAAKDPANPVGKLVSAQQPLGLNYLAFAVDPLGLYRVEPGALDGQQTWNYPDPTVAGFDPAVMDDDPLSYLMALVPTSVVPDTQIRSKAFLPLCWSFSQHHPRNRVVMALTGRPSTNLSQVSSNSGT